MMTLKQSLTEALVGVFGAGCNLDWCRSHAQELRDNKSFLLIDIALEKLDEAQDALLVVSGLSVEDVQSEYLKVIEMKSGK
jgi:hypothetical protein